MIEKNKKYDGYWDAACDKCGKEERLIQADSFLAALGTIKSLGWTVERNEKRNWWEHKCPDCATGSTTVIEVDHPGYG